MTSTHGYDLLSTTNGGDCVNHCDNDRRDQVEETKETLGQKIFRIFKPDTPPHQKAARKLLLEARRARTPGSKKK